MQSKKRSFSRERQHVLYGHDDDLTPFDRLLLLYIRERDGNGDGCFVKRRKIADELGISRLETLDKHLKKLVKLGYVEKKRRRGRPSIHWTRIPIQSCDKCNQHA